MLLYNNNEIKFVKILRKKKYRTSLFGSARLENSMHHLICTKKIICNYHAVSINNTLVHRNSNMKKSFINHNISILFIII